MRIQWISIAILACGGAVGCSSGAKLDDPMPSDPLEFRTFLKERMSEALAQTNCQCCNKPLLQCYNETLERSEGYCPDHCSTCLIEGRVAYELKKKGLSNQEIARQTVAVVMGKVSPPEGVDLNRPVPGMPEHNPAHHGHGHRGHEHKGQGHDHGGHEH